MRLQHEYLRKKAADYVTGQFNTYVEQFECQFHYLLQNPKDGAVILDRIGAEAFNTETVRRLLEYFDAGGNCVFSPFKTLQFTNVRLKVDTRFFSLIFPFHYICELIKKNPKLEIIDLSNTQLGDTEAQQLIWALRTNNRLKQLKLDGNSISHEFLGQIAVLLAQNRSMNEFEKAGMSFTLRPF